MPRDSLDDLYARTKESISKARESIASLQPAQNDLTMASKKVVEVCLICGTLAVHLLKTLGPMYPMCSKVADVLSAAIQMEQEREKNDVRIVSVYIELAEFICELKLVKSPTCSIIKCFNQLVIQPMENLLRRFSEFSGKYYGPGGTTSRFRGLQNLCRNILSADKHRKDLYGFLNEIINLRSQLNNLLTTKITTALDRNVYKIIISQTSIEGAMGGYVYVTARGPTMLDREGLEQILQWHLSDSALFGLFWNKKELSIILQSTLDGWKETEKQNKAVFDLKFNLILDKLSAETEYRRDWLKGQADGPHNTIPDPDFRKIWLQTAGQRSSVERRRFIDGLSRYFALEMKRATTVGAAWTLDIICSVPYHDAICDAIDRDASGYISISDLVAFLQRKPQALRWTNLQWLAYCAYGWHADNIFFSEQLDRLLAKAHESKAYFRCFEKPLRMIQNGLHPLAKNLTPRAAKNMDEMILQRRAWITQGIKNGLIKSSYRLDLSLVSLIAGDDRVEWWFFPTAFVLFSYQNDVPSASKDTSLKHFIEDVQTSLKTLFKTYDARADELNSIWRRRLGDTTKAMRHYANGLFANYFKVPNDPQLINRPVPKPNLPKWDMIPNRWIRCCKPFGHYRDMESDNMTSDDSLAEEPCVEVPSPPSPVCAFSGRPSGHSPGMVPNPCVDALPAQSTHPAQNSCPAQSPCRAQNPCFAPNPHPVQIPLPARYAPPTLVLEPLDGSFQRKYLRLSQPIRLGKEMVRGTSPLEKNGIFACEALCTGHAEVGDAGGKVYIKDLGSTNGTYVNGKRLSREGIRSLPLELQNGDILHLGPDFGSICGVTARVQILVEAV